jgi:hypothetical protein
VHQAGARVLCGAAAPGPDAACADPLRFSWSRADGEQSGSEQASGRLRGGVRGRRAGALTPALRVGQVYFEAVAAQCLTATPHKGVRRLAYSFVRSCPGAAELAAWIVVREAVLRDMRDPEPELASAAIAAIASLPLPALQPAATKLAQSLTAMLTHGDATSEGVRRSAVQGASVLLLRVGEITVASEASSGEAGALHALARALAASALDSSTMVSSEAMDSLASLCSFAPASSRLIGAEALGDVLRLPNTSISILAPEHHHVLRPAADSRGRGAAIAQQTRSGASCLTGPAPSSPAHVWSSGALGILARLASLALAWLQPHLALLLARFECLQDRERRRATRFIVLLLAASLTSAAPPAPPSRAAHNKAPQVNEAAHTGGSARDVEYEAEVEAEGEGEADWQEGVGGESLGWEAVEQVLAPLSNFFLFFLLIFFYVQVLAPLARSSDGFLSLEACQALLQLSRLVSLYPLSGSGSTNCATSCQIRWALIVVEGSLATISRADTEAGGRQAMRHLLIALHLLPPELLQGNLARQVPEP